MNRLGEGIAFAHSGITAEGDNRVLMQKVTKEIMALHMKQQFLKPLMTKCPIRELPLINDINTLDIMYNFVAYREFVLMNKLANHTQESIK